MISSEISKPTLYDGVFEYGSKIIRDDCTSTNVPLIKYTPLFTPNAEPVQLHLQILMLKQFLQYLKLYYHK